MDIFETVKGAAIFGAIVGAYLVGDSLGYKGGYDQGARDTLAHVDQLLRNPNSDYLDSSVDRESHELKFRECRILSNQRETPVIFLQTADGDSSQVY